MKVVFDRGSVDRELGSGDGVALDLRVVSECAVPRAWGEEEEVDVRG